MAERKYEADGTIHVCYGRCEKVEAVTFIPHQYVEQGAGKFAVFVPRGESMGTRKAQNSLVVKAGGLDGTAKGVKLLCAANFGTPLLHAAAHRVKVTVVVSLCSNECDLALQEIIVPAIPTKPSTA